MPTRLLNTNDSTLLATDTAILMAAAAALRDQGHGQLVTYSRKVFIPLTQLCRDVCHYCTFAKTPKRLDSPYLDIGQVLELARHGQRMGCQEALFTLGEKPELRYRAAREALAAMGYNSTTEYLGAAAKAVFEETGLLPHLNPGTMTDEEMMALRPWSPSMGIMLESASDRLCAKGMPHHGSPDKVPAVRLDTLERAGAARIPFTTGILIGIGETRQERLDSLRAIHAIHARHGHIQEIIVQNFRAKPDTLMARAPEPDLEELLWTIAAARLIFGPDMAVQAPPNLSPGVLPKLLDAGINDWGGVSPVSPDHVNPEAPWPQLDDLARETAAAGKLLHQRLTVYPRFALDPTTWLDTGLRQPVLDRIDGSGLPRDDQWTPGGTTAPPADLLAQVRSSATGPGAPAVADSLHRLLAKAATGAALSEAELEPLWQARGKAFTAVCRAADELRQETCGDTVTWAVNRNINYTNICYFKCQFCAFSKGKLSENLRGRPYDLGHDEIARRVTEAWQRGATEVCMQGGIHPEYTGETYLAIVRAVKAAQPDMHVHAFSPLEIWQGAATLNLPLAEYLAQLRDAGLGTLPGTAAEVLDDEVRAVLCPDKINTGQWLAVMRAAHGVGLRSTATIMFGHVDRYAHWSRHLLRVRDLQADTGGFTEFVPLPFVHMEAPMYLKGKARPGPGFREAVLMHAVARLALHGQIDNIQASWVKMGHAGLAACLDAGCNDLGGTLMNESITRAAGAAHGEETTPEEMMAMIRASGREPRQRTTLYGRVPDERQQAGRGAAAVAPIVNTPARRWERASRQPLVKPGLGVQANARDTATMAPQPVHLLASRPRRDNAQDVPPMVEFI